MENYEINQQAATQSKTPKETVSFWSYLGMILLFSIPVIGWIVCIVFMFAPKNKSKKNYARAAMTWMVLQLISLVLVLSLAISLIGAMLLPTINDALGTNFQSIHEVLDMSVDALAGDYTGMIIHFRPQLLEMMGEEYAAFLDELASGDYKDLFKQFKNEQYNEILNDLQNGKYPKLTATLKPEDYALVIQELESVANGEPSEIIDQIRSIAPPIF